MPDAPFREIALQFLAHHDIYSEDRKTMRLRIRVLERYLGDHTLPEINQAAIEAMFAARLQEGVARSTINRARAALSSLFSWAIERGHFPGPNPVGKVRKFRESPGRLRYLTPGEADRLTLAAPAHLQGVIAVALNTGARLREILTLTWADVDLAAGVVTFRREVTKSRKTRNVPIIPALHNILAALRRGRPDQLVFTWNDRPLRSVRTAFEGARRKAGLEEIRFHDLRHTFASHAVMNGLDLVRLQHYLGHSTVAMTQRYAHLSEDHLREGARFLGLHRTAGGRNEQGRE
jgi:integrase